MARSSEPRVSRRRFIEATGAAGIAVGLAGCSSGGGNNNTNNTTTNGNGGGSSTSGGSTTGDTSSSSSNGGTTTVQFAADSIAGDNQKGINEALHSAGLSKDVKVSVLAGSSVTNNREQKYTQWLSSGRAEPDILMMDSGWTIPFIVRDQLENLSKQLDSGTRKTVENDYFDAAVKTAQSPSSGDLYGVPFFPDFPTMLYRKDLFEQAGHAPQDSWATKSIHWKEFSKAVADAKSKGGTQYGYTWQANVYEGLSCCDFNELMSSWGGAYFGGEDNLFGPIGKRPVTVDQQPVIDAIEMGKTFISGPDAKNTRSDYEQISPQAVLQWTENPSLKPFQNGKAVAHRNWSYAIKQTVNSKAVGGDKLGVMPIPYHVSKGAGKYKGLGGPTASLGGWNVALNPNSKKKDAAVEVLKTLPNDQFQLQLTQLTGWLTPKPKLFDSQKMKDLPALGPYIDSLKVAGNNAVPRPVTAVWPQESKKIAQKVNAALSGDETPKKAMSSLAKTLTAIENRS